MAKLPEGNQDPWDTPSPFEIPLFRDVKIPTDQLSRFPSQDFLHLPGRPEIKEPFLSLAVCVFRGIESPFRMGHDPLQIVKYLSHRSGISRVSGDLEGLGVGHHQHGLVVEHLFEVWDMPLSIHAVAMKPKTNMIENPTTAHGHQRLLCHCQGFGRLRAFVPAKEEGQMVRGWKLRGGTKPTVGGIVGLPQLVVRLPESFLVQGIHPRGIFGHLFQKGGGLLPSLEDLSPLILPELGNLGEKVEKSRHSEAALFREIGPRVEGLPLRGEKNGKGPTPVPG